MLFTGPSRVREVPRRLGRVRRTRPEPLSRALLPALAALAPCASAMRGSRPACAPCTARRASSPAFTYRQGPDSYPPPSLESSSSESSSVASGCALSLSLAIAALSSAGFYSAKEHIAAHDVGPDAGRDTPDRVRGRFILHCRRSGGAGRGFFPRRS